MSQVLYHTARASFQASRWLLNLPDGRRERNLHGHGFSVRVRTAHRPGLDGDALSAHLQEAVSPLDYNCLNDHISVPDDEALLRWIARRLDLDGLSDLHLAVTPDHGAVLDGQGQPQGWRRFRFEAAHRLPHVSEDHPCGRMHGHSFRVLLMARDGDWAVLERAWAPLHQQLHYACLNDLPGLDNPTSEMLAAWLWQRLVATLPGLTRVTVFETATAGCHYDGRDHRIWKERRLEAALRLHRGGPDDPRRRLHGHSYTTRLHLSAPLDPVLGWTVDYGDMKALFEPVYRQLDHHRLDRLQGLDDADLPDLLNWIRQRMQSRLAPLDRIDLERDDGPGAQLHWRGA